MNPARSAPTIPTIWAQARSYRQVSQAIPDATTAPMRNGAMSSPSKTSKVTITTTIIAAAISVIPRAWVAECGVRSLSVTVLPPVLRAFPSAR